MRRVGRCLREHFFGVLLIIVLLVLQVFCDLRLPEYTADIIDIGIGQSGIESPLVPELSETGMQHLLLLMTQEEQDITLAGYVKDGEVYRKQKLKEEDERALEETMTAPMVAVYALSTDGADYQEVLGDLYVPRGMDVFGILSALPDNARLGLTEAAREQIRQVPQNLITQAAVNFVREDMSARGIDVDKLQRRYLTKKGLLMVLAAIAAMIFAVLAAALASWVSVDCAGRLQQEMFERTVSCRETGDDALSVSELVSRSTEDIRRVRRMLSVFFRMVLYALLLGAGAVSGMILLNRSFGRIAVAAMLLAALLTAGCILLAVPRYRALQRHREHLAGTVRETVRGIMTIRVLGTQKREQERLIDESRTLMKTTVRSGRSASLALPLLLLLMDAAVLLAAWRGAAGINEGSLLSGELVAGIQYAMMEIGAFVTLAAFLTSVPEGISAAARVEEALGAGTEPGRDAGEKPSVRHGAKTGGRSEERNTAEDAEDGESADGTRARRAPAVEFHNVSYTYPGQSSPALKDISFTVDYGEKAALIGGMGSGKTTLLQMASSILDPTEGEIRIDGKPVGEYETRKRREKIGYVPQEAFLFSGTVASNLRFGKPEATPEEMRLALQTAQAETFVMESGEGLEMELAQGGANLSGGQRQRLTIARALVGAPQVFLFDDCFSALDADTDARLWASLGQKTKNSAVLLADQQVRRVMDADRIIVLDGGQIVGIGRHEELMRTCETYRQIALSQDVEEQENA